MAPTAARRPSSTEWAATRQSTRSSDADLSSEPSARARRPTASTASALAASTFERHTWVSARGALAEQRRHARRLRRELGEQPRRRAQEARVGGVAERADERREDAAAEDGAPVVEAAAGDGGEQLGRRAQRLGPLAPHDDDERREHAVVEHRLPPRVVDADDAQLRERLARLRLALGVAEARVHVEQPHAALERRRLLRAARERAAYRASDGSADAACSPEKTRDADATSASSSVASVSILGGDHHQPCSRCGPQPLAPKLRLTAGSTACRSRSRHVISGVP